MYYLLHFGKIMKVIDKEDYKNHLASRYTKALF